MHADVLAEMFAENSPHPFNCCGFAMDWGHWPLAKSLGQWLEDTMYGEEVIDFVDG